MDQDTNKNASRSTAILARDPWGLAVLLGFVAILLAVVWFARTHHATIPAALVITLVCISFGWASLAMWQVHRGCRKLGWDRSHYTQLLAGLRPDDPNALFIWFWTLQLCYAILAVVLCMLAIGFAA